MTSFQDKERAHESKYAFNKEQEFRATARRNKLFGLWAAEKMHYDEEKAAAYAKEVVVSDFEEPGEDDVFRKVQGDLQKAGLTVPEQELRTKMSELMVIAREQISEEA